MSARPFLKWVGGKRQLVPRLLAALPPVRGRYFEPFVGGGALFFALRPEHAVLADRNVRLARTYRAVQTDVEAVIGKLRAYPYERAFFEAMREKPVDRFGDARVAAWMIYLNRAGFNGLYRVNGKGVFNVGFGRYTDPTICDAENLRACAEALRNVLVLACDFADAVGSAERGDVVYFDPPYVPLSATSSFTKYTGDGFGEWDHERLRDTAMTLRRRGVHVLLSNSSAPLVRHLYARHFAIEEIDARRSVNSRTDRRGAVKELLLHGPPLPRRARKAAAEAAP